MLYEISHKYRLWRLQKRQKAVAGENDEMVSSLVKAKKDSDDIRQAEYGAFWDDQQFEGRIDQLESRYLIHQIRKYGLAYPAHEDWELNETSGHRHLKREAMVRVRRDIRSEKKERWEAWLRWLPIVTALTGLLGTLIGLVSALMR